MRSISQVLRLLRSPRLAFGLVLGVAAYSALGTIVPQVATRSVQFLQWRLTHGAAAELVSAIDLNHAYSAPFFLMLVALLAASTTVCAWDRSVRSWRLHRSGGIVSDALVARLKKRPLAVVATGEGTSPTQVADALRSIGLRARSGPRLVEAAAGRVGLVGSPLFHWSLVALFLVIGLGQLTRSEGQMGVPVGGSRQDVTQSYGTVQAGALFRGHSGLTIAVPRVQKTLILGGVNRDAAPEVALFEGNRLLKRQLVYPNNPLRYGSLLIHRGPFGFALPLTLESSAGVSIARFDLLIDVATGSGAGTVPTGVSMQGEPGRSVDITFTLVANRDSNGRQLITPSQSMQVALQASGVSVPATVAAPGVIPLPQGQRLVLGSVTNYARLSVVSDWSVYLIYALLGSAIIGLALALLMPFRSAWVLLVETTEGVDLHVISRHSRRDPTFTESIVSVLRELTSPAEEKQK